MRGVNNIGDPKMKNNYWCKLFLFQYCDCNIGFFTIALPTIVIAIFVAPFGF